MTGRGRKGRSRALPWVLLCALVVGIVAWAAWPSGEPTARERAEELASELRCPDCESLSVSDSDTASARAIRRDIGDRVTEGQSDAVIRRAYVDRYGESILLKPENGGLGLVVWGLPIVAVVVGGGALALTLARWRRQPRLHATDADEVLVGRVRSQPR
jgi:cytochrome c-type biogenesis protein CcmH